MGKKNDIYTGIKRIKKICDEYGLYFSITESRDILEYRLERYPDQIFRKAGLKSLDIHITG